VVQFVPIKKEGATPAEHDVRPVACGGSGRRAIGRCTLFEKRDALRERCEPVQLAQGTSGGTQANGFIVLLHMHHFCNTHIWRFMDAHMRPESPIFYSHGGKLEKLDYLGVQGGQQGAFEASSGFNETTLNLFIAANDLLGTRGGCARATVDDLTLCDTPALVWTALANLQRDMEVQLGMFLQTIKTEVYSQNEVYGNMPVGVKVGEGRWHGRPCCHRGPGLGARGSPTW
jgi:hypothetical protein